MTSSTSSICTYLRCRCLCMSSMFTGPSFARALREAAPSLSRRLFSSHCQSPSTHRILRQGARDAFRHVRTSTSSRLSSQQAFRTNRTPPGCGGTTSRYFSVSLRRRSAASITVEGSQPAKKSRWPETTSNIVAYWLLGSAASVFGIVVFGGLTRLTESG